MNYQSILQDVHATATACGRDPQEITLIVVSKKRSLEQIQLAINAGATHFGENRLPEALEKIETLPSLDWHFIGTLQRKKVPKVIGKFSLIHSVDTPELAEKLCQPEPTPVLFQVNTSGEESKHGFSPDADFQSLIKLPGLDVQGLMTMAPNTSDEKTIRNCFRKLRELRDDLQLKHLSMGMSNDYRIAIEEGATLLRLGSAIFDVRN